MPEPDTLKNNTMPEYPQSLIEYLQEQDAEGNEIFTSYTEDGTMFIVKPTGLENWIVVVEWYPGSDDFQIVNVSGKAFRRLFSVMFDLVKHEVDNAK